MHSECVLLNKGGLVAQSKKIKDPQIKQFRQSQEVENFYRFIHDNSLRHEAKTLLEFVFEKVKKISKKAK